VNTIHTPENHPRRRAGDNVRLPNPVVAAIRRNPVLVGMTLALALATIALVLVLGAQSDIKSQQSALEKQNTALRDFISDSQINRRTNSTETCKAINANADAVNKVISYVIENAPVQNKDFNAGLNKLRATGLDCTVLLSRIQAGPKP
jgi:hypothetical protein